MNVTRNVLLRLGFGLVIQLTKGIRNMLTKGVKDHAGKSASVRSRKVYSYDGISNLNVLYLPKQAYHIIIRITEM